MPEVNTRPHQLQQNASLKAADTLKAYAREIHKIHGRVLADFFRVGEILLEARDVIRAKYVSGETDGRWLRWLKEDVKMGHQQATRFIAVYQKYGGVPLAEPIFQPTVLLS